MPKKKDTSKKAVGVNRKSSVRVPEGLNQALLGRIRAIFESARTHVAHSVNTTQVVANWLVGREIEVE